MNCSMYLSWRVAYATLSLCTTTLHNKKEYRFALCKPVLFLFLDYFIFSNVEFIYEKTKFVFPITVIGAGLNIILNFIFIPLFGYGTAAYTTLISYAIVAVCHYLVTLLILKRNAYPMITVCAYLALLIIATAVMPLIYKLYFLIRYAIVLLSFAALAFVLLRSFKTSK